MARAGRSSTSARWCRSPDAAMGGARCSDWGWLGGRFLSVSPGNGWQHDRWRSGPAMCAATLRGGRRARTRSARRPRLGGRRIHAIRHEPDTAAAVCVIALLGLFSTPNLFPDVPVMFGTFSVGAASKAAEYRRPLARWSPATFSALTPTPASRSAMASTSTNVTFRYPPAPIGPWWSFTSTSTSRLSQRLAVVGLNGAGKTTLVKLLCRLYRPRRRLRRGRRDRSAPRRSGAVATAHGGRVPGLHPLAPTPHDNVELRSTRRRRSTDDADAAGVVGRRAGRPRRHPRAPAERVDTPLHPAAWRGGPLRRAVATVALARGLAVEHGASVLVLDEADRNLDPRSEFDFYDACSAVRSPPPGRSRRSSSAQVRHRPPCRRHRRAGGRPA